MSSGIEVEDECKTLFGNFKGGKKLYRFICLRVADNQKVIYTYYIES